MGKAAGWVGGKGLATERYQLTVGSQPTRAHACGGSSEMNRPLPCSTIHGPAAVLDEGGRAVGQIWELAIGRQRPLAKLNDGNDRPTDGPTDTALPSRQHCNADEVVRAVHPFLALPTEVAVTAIHAAKSKMRREPKVIEERQKDCNEKKEDGNATASKTTHMNEDDAKRAASQPARLNGLEERGKVVMKERGRRKRLVCFALSFCVCHCPLSESWLAVRLAWLSIVEKSHMTSHNLIPLWQDNLR